MLLTTAPLVAARVALTNPHSAALGQHWSALQFADEEIVAVKPRDTAQPAAGAGTGIQKARLQSPRPHVVPLAGDAITKFLPSTKLSAPFKGSSRPHAQGASCRPGVSAPLNCETQEPLRIHPARPQGILSGARNSWMGKGWELPAPSAVFPPKGTCSRGRYSLEVLKDLGGLRNNRRALASILPQKHAHFGARPGTLICLAISPFPHSA